MVRALVELFHSTGGAAGGEVAVPLRGGGARREVAEGWARRDAWLQGEPCADGWFGVICCPDARPLYRAVAVGGDDWRCFAEEGEADGGGAAAFDWRAGAPAVSPAGCASGSTTGGAADAARCVVVGLQLPSNRLVGALGDALCDGLPYLARLDVSGNELTGRLPRCAATQLSSAVLAANSFWYLEGSPALRSLVSRCRTAAGTDCRGVPPLGCTAFGPARYEVRSDDSERCVECPDVVVSALLQLGAILLFALLLGGYLVLVAHFQRLEEKLDLWINTAAIFFCHLQTVSIIGTLKLAWPPSVEAITEIASVDFLSLGAIRPECLLQLGENSFYYLTIFRMLLLLVLVLGVSVLQAVVKWCAPASAAGGLRRTVRRVDQLEVAESVLFTLGLSLSWRIIFDFWEQNMHLGLAKTGVALASLLFVVQLVFLAKYALNIRALVTGRGLDLTLWSRGPCPVRVATARHLSHERLQLRLSFLTERFAPHAPYWQFVVWLRQFLLTLDAWVAESVMDDADSVREGVVACAGGDGSDANVNASSSGNATYGGGSGEEACVPLSSVTVGAVFTHAACAALIFAGFWRLQLRHRPFVHRFQNDVESFLFAANLLLVALGTWYTALRLRGVASAGIEALMATLLVLSLLGAAGFIGYQSRAAHLARRHAKHAQHWGRWARSKTGAAPVLAGDKSASSWEDFVPAEGGGAAAAPERSEQGGCAFSRKYGKPPSRSSPGSPSSASPSRGDASAASGHAMLTCAADADAEEAAALAAARPGWGGRLARFWRPGRAPANAAAAQAVAAAGDRATETLRRCLDAAAAASAPAVETELASPRPAAAPASPLYRSPAAPKSSKELPASPRGRSGSKSSVRSSLAERSSLVSAAI